MHLNGKRPPFRCGRHDTFVFVDERVKTGAVMQLAVDARHKRAHVDPRIRVRWSKNEVQHGGDNVLPCDLCISVIDEVMHLQEV